MKDIFRKTFNGIIFCCLTVILCQPAFAEYILVKNSKTGPEPIVYRSLNTKERNEVDEIYENILMVYQWPMLTMHYAQMDLDIQKRIQKALKNKFGLLNFAKNLLQEKFENRYDILYMPETIFEIGTLITFVNEHIELAQSASAKGIKVTENSPSLFAENDVRNCMFGAEDFRGQVLHPGIRLHLEKEAKKKEVPLAKKYGVFLNKGYGVHNFRPEIKEVYFETCELLVTRLGGKTKDISDIKNTIPSLVKEYIDLTPQFLEAILKVNPTLAFLANGLMQEEYINIQLNNDYTPYLIDAAQAHYKAEEKGNFLLFRGTGLLELSDKQKVIDAPSRDLKDDYAHIVGQSAEFKKLIERHYNVKEPEKLSSSIYSDFQKNTFSPTSLSFGNTILSGSIYELAKGGGARPLDYVIKKKKGYMLSLPIWEYLTTPPDQQLYFISPFNTVMSMFGKGELFHSRSKVSFYKTGASWKGYINGLGIVSEEDKDIILQDLDSAMSYLILSGIEWSALSGKITSSIAAHTEFIPSDEIIFPAEEKSELLAIQKGLGLFEFEAAGLKEHLRKYKHIVHELETRKPTLKSIKTNVKNEVSVIDNGTPLVVKKDVKKAKEVSQKISNKLLKKINPSPKISISTQYDDRVYDPNNVFGRILQNPKTNVKTELFRDTPHSLAFDDLRKRTREHFLVIPKGPYISFPHFVDHVDNNDEIVDMLRTIAAIAEKKGLDKTGYRIISNHAIKPGSPTNNDANQEVPHFHIHVAGGECLGKPVAGVPLLNIEEKEKIENDLSLKITDHNNQMQILAQQQFIDPELVTNEAKESEKLKKLNEEWQVYKIPPSRNSAKAEIPNNASIPFGVGLTTKHLVQLAYKNKVAEEQFNHNGQDLTFLAYTVPERRDNIPHYIGFIVCDNEKTPLYQSFHTFAQEADGPLAKALFSFISNVAKAMGIHETGYRLVSNTGQDAWQKPAVFQLFIAGGAPLSATATNVYGNRKKKSESVWDTPWDTNYVYDYADILHLPHEHCPIISKFNQSTRDINELASLQIKNTKLYDGILTEYNNMISSIQDTITNLSSTYSEFIENDYSEPLREKGRATKINFLNGTQSDLNVLGKEIGELEKEAVSSQSHQNLDKHKQTNDKLAKISSKITEFNTKLENIKTEIQFTSDLKYGALSSSNLDAHSWVFLDIDGVLTKGIDTTEWTDDSLKQLIIDLQHQGVKIMALTNRHYWEGMDDMDTNAAHKDTFKLLETLGITFSNPGDLKPFIFNTYTDNPKNQPQFKDGVIFCADHQDGKSEFLAQYLLNLVNNGVKEFPRRIIFVDDIQEHVVNVVNAMYYFNIPTKGYIYSGSS